MVTVVGVDGARGGWAVAVVDVDDGGRPDDGPGTRTDVGTGRTDGTGAARSTAGTGGTWSGLVTAVRWEYVPGQDASGFTRVLDLADVHRAAAVGVDCPIGLPEDGWRPCDLLAKRRLGRGSARVFLVPPRPVLAAPTYADARAVARDLIGKGISAQTYGIRRIVLAVDDVLRTRPDLRDRVAEVHPELSFAALTGRAPGDPLPGKRSEAGRQARVRALSGWLSPDVDLAAPDGDDHLDALAAAWSVRRLLRGEAEVLGGEQDRAGLPMRIVV